MSLISSIYNADISVASIVLSCAPEVFSEILRLEVSLAVIVPEIESDSSTATVKSSVEANTVNIDKDVDSEIDTEDVSVV